MAGLLAERRAPVSAIGDLGVPRAPRFWIGDWERFSSRGAVADQVRFDREWGALRAYARDRGIQILGDVAIYVSPDGADHRFHPELFQTRRGGGRAPRRLRERWAAVGQPAV